MEVEEEVSRMGDIYERATCTIAATAARNVHDGFLKALDVYQAANPYRIKDCSQFMSKHLMNRHLMARNLMARNLMARNLIARHLMGRYLMDRYFMDRHLMARHL
jgi:hypothetical protein